MTDYADAVLAMRAARTAVKVAEEAIRADPADLAARQRLRAATTVMRRLSEHEVPAALAETPIPARRASVVCLYPDSTSQHLTVALETRVYVCRPEGREASGGVASADRARLVEYGKSVGVEVLVKVIK